MFKILVKFNQAVIKVHVIEKEVTTFGRKEDNDIVIDNAAVSGAHGKIVKTGDHYEVVDLSSTNGTYVNGRPVKQSRIKNKDQIRVARHILEVWSDEDPVEPEVQKESGTPPKAPLPPLAQAPTPAIAEPGPKPNILEELAPTPKFVLPPATIKVIAGGVGEQSEFPLGPNVTYIGTSDQAVIKIKGFMAPGLAAAVMRKAEGYVLKAVKPGYPKVNGVVVTDSVPLESGAFIEMGGTNLLFTIDNPKPKEQG